MVAPRDAALGGRGRCLITETWPIDAANPKAPVLERRLRATRLYIDTWKREIDMLTRILGRHATPGGRMLEVASGTGFTLLELANQGFRCCGLDFDPHLCRLIHQAADRFTLDVECTAADGCAIPYRAGSFDAVLSKSYFEHVYDFELALSEQIRVVRPGGVVIIIDGNFLNPKLFLDLFVRYPIRTRGRHGGLKWLFTKTRVHENLYGYLKLGKDEDVKTVRWWRRAIARTPGVRLVEATTSGKYLHPSLPAFLHPFVGACVTVVERQH